MIRLSNNEKLVGIARVESLEEDSEEDLEGKEEGESEADSE